LSWSTFTKFEKLDDHGNAIFDKETETKKKPVEGNDEDTDSGEDDEIIDY
jgi:hypothetical protein